MVSELIDPWQQKRLQRGNQILGVKRFGSDWVGEREFSVKSLVAPTTTDRPYAFFGYGGGLDRRNSRSLPRSQLAADGIGLGEGSGPQILVKSLTLDRSVKTTKSMVRYEEVASDPTAVWRIATVANHKADMVQQQRGDFQKSFNRLKESMNRVEASLQRMIEGLRQINPISTQGVHLHGTPEGNHISLPTAYSVVVTGWEQDQVPNGSVRGMDWENPDEVGVKNDARLEDGTVASKSQGVEFTIKGDLDCAVLEDFGIPSWLFSPKDIDEGDFGIPSWLFGLSLSDAVDRAKDLAVFEMNAPTDLLKPINVGLSSALRVGQQYLASGNPFGFDHILTAGVIRGVNRDIFSNAGVTSEDGAHFHMKQGAFLHNLKAPTLPKSFYCSFIRLTLEYFKYSSLDSYEFSACKMNRTLVSLMWILDQMPEERTILIKLLYFCKCCTDNEVINIWNKNHWKIEVGNVSSKHLVLALKIKSVLYLCDDNNENCEDDNMSLDNESDQDDDFFDTEVRPSEVDCYINAPNDGNYKGHSGTISEKDTQDAFHKEELTALVREWICSRDIGTVDISDVLSNSPDISIAVVEDIMQQMLFKEPEGRQLFVSGHIRGGIEISGKMRSFNVVTKEAFEVSLADVSQTQIQGQGAKGDVQSDEHDKLRSLKEFGFPEYNPIFMRNRRRNKRRGLYGYVAGLGDSGSILYKTGPIIGGGLLRRSAEISVYDYFVNSRGIELKYSGDLPCTNVGKLKRPTYFPIGLCSLVPLQRYTKALSTLQRSLLVEKSMQKLQERMSVLYDVLRHSNYDAELMLKVYGFLIALRFTQVGDRVLQALEMALDDICTTAISGEDGKSIYTESNSFDILLGVLAEESKVVDAPGKDEVGSKHMSYLPDMIPCLLGLLNDETPAVARQAVKSGTNLFATLLEQLVIQGLFSSDGIEDSINISWEWLLKLKSVVSLMAFQHSINEGVRLLAVKLVKKTVLMYTLDPNIPSDSPSEATGDMRFNVAWLRGGHPMLNVGDLAMEASQSPGLWLEQLKSLKVKSLSTSMIIVLVSSLSAIDPGRHSFYGRILPVLLSLDPASSIVKMQVPGAFHALKSAFTACLKCTHSSTEPWRARLWEAQNIINQGDSIEHTVNDARSFGDTSNRAESLLLTEASTDNSNKCSLAEDRNKMLEDGGHSSKGVRQSHDAQEHSEEARREMLSQLLLMSHLAKPPLQDLGILKLLTSASVDDAAVMEDLLTKLETRSLPHSDRLVIQLSWGSEEQT